MLFWGLVFSDGYERNRVHVNDEVLQLICVINFAFKKKRNPDIFRTSKVKRKLV